jgi:predicted peptidase
MNRACLVTLVALCSGIAGCAARDRWTLAPGQHAQSFERRVTVDAHGRLLLYLPAGFDARSGKRYPLLIYLHGTGESGEDLEKVKAHGPPQFLDSRPDFPFIVASPQSPRNILGFGFDAVTLNAMLDELLAQLPIDSDRVYLTGNSMGGIWTYGWASLHPERFAAIAPVCGRWDVVDACRLKAVPVWAFHGAKDDVIPLADDQSMIDAIKSCGGDARLTVYPEAGHDAWTQTYADQNLYGWLLEQRRKPASAAR